MKQGALTVREFAKTVLDQKELKADYLADTKSMQIITGDPDHLFLDFVNPVAEGGIGAFERIKVSSRAARQIADKVKIPWKYFDRMQNGTREDRYLLQQNIDHWFSTEPKMRMLRTFKSNNPTLRAFLGNGYHRIDNHDVIQTILPIVLENGATIRSQELTDDHLYIKLITDKLEGQVVGDVVRGGIMIRNSETGMGSLTLTPFTEVLACTNGMVHTRGFDGEVLGYKKRHIGSSTLNRISGSSGSSGSKALFLSPETRMLQDAAILSEIADTTSAILNEETFRGIIDKMSEASSRTLGNPIETVELLQSTFGVSNDEKDGILGYLAKGGNESLYHTSQAVTAYSQDVEDYTRATELEMMGWDVLHMSQAVSLN